MEYVKKKCIIDDLKKYVPSCNEDDFIEISEWISGEGYDININDNKRISLSFEEFEGIKHIISCLEHEGDKFE